MKTLIIGFGSIGKRHYKNLIGLGFKDVWVYDIDKKKLKDRKLKTVGRLNPETLKEFEIALICNPNHLHVKTAIQCAKAGCHLFIEKPLSHNLKEIDKLLKICQRKKLVNMTACDMRFHPCFKFIKDYLDRKKLGRVYSISLEFGYYLPYWREGQDYRKNYAAKKATGGGIILDDIHEFDLLFWLNNYQKVMESKFVFGKASNLQIETEDICQAVFKFENKLIGLVSSDYLQQDYTRKCKIIGEKGNLEWDLNEDKVRLQKKGDKGKGKILNIGGSDSNKPYIDEMKYFFNCCKKKQKTFNDIKRARDILKHCLKR